MLLHLGAMAVGFSSICLEIFSSSVVFSIVGSGSVIVFVSVLFGVTSIVSSTASSILETLGRIPSVSDNLDTSLIGALDALEAPVIILPKV